MVRVEHEQEKNRFIINLGDNLAVLDYDLAGKKINFTRTYVPHASRGKGYAELLVKTGMNWAREQSFEIRASCWFARKYLE